MKRMLNEIRQIHEKFNFKDNGGEDMLFRMNLMMEEIGEICACVTKGKGNLAEEHADLLIILLGNCIALDIDIEGEFWRKVEKMKNYKIQQVNGYSRLVSK